MYTFEIDLVLNTILHHETVIWFMYGILHLFSCQQSAYLILVLWTVTLLI